MKKVLCIAVMGIALFASCLNEIEEFDIRDQAVGFFDGGFETSRYRIRKSYDRDDEMEIITFDDENLVTYSRILFNIVERKYGFDYEVISRINNSRINNSRINNSEILAKGRYDKTQDKHIWRIWNGDIVVFTRVYYPYFEN